MTVGGYRSSKMETAGGRVGGGRLRRSSRRRHGAAIQVTRAFRPMPRPLAPFKLRVRGAVPTRRPRGCMPKWRSGRAPSLATIKRRKSLLHPRRRETRCASAAGAAGPATASGRPAAGLGIGQCQDGRMLERRGWLGTSLLHTAATRCRGRWRPDSEGGAARIYIGVFGDFGGLAADARIETARSRLG